MLANGVNGGVHMPRDKTETHEKIIPAAMAEFTHEATSGMSS